jgi:septin family protein
LSIDSPFMPHYLETEFDHERIGVTIWDSQGLEKKFVDLQLREMSSFLESKFEETFTEEQKVVRAPGVRDTHIHCVFLILDPSRLDANLGFTQKQSKSPSARFDEPLRLKTLQGKTTVIPVISKADTITTNHMSQLKRAVWDSLKQAKLDPLEALAFNEEDDEDSDERLDERDEDAMLHEEDVDDNDDSGLVDELVDRSEDVPGPLQGELNNQLRQNHRRTPSGLGNRLSQAEISGDGKSESPYLPMSIISPDTYEPGVVGRRFPWGFADPYNPDHCDFVRLKDSVFSEWRGELREASREIWYEGWRTSRLNRRGGTAQGAKGASSTNGRSRQVSGSRTAASTSSPYGGGPVGHAGNAAAYSRPAQQHMHGQARPSVPPPGQGTPEMVRGVFRQGVNAF